MTDRGPIRISPSGRPIVGGADGDILVWDNTAQDWVVMAGAVTPVFGEDYQSALSLARTTTTSAAFITKTTLVTPALTGTYRVGWHAVVDGTAGGTEVEARLQNITDAVTEGALQFYEPDDSDQLEDMNGFVEVVFAGAAKTFEIQFRRVNVAGSAGMQDARIEFWRVL